MKVLNALDMSSQRINNLADPGAAQDAATQAYVLTQAGLLVPKSTVTTKGDLIVASANAAVARLGVGSNDQAVVADSSATNGVSFAHPAHAHSAYLKPTAALYETFDRSVASPANQASSLTSGTLKLIAIALPSGLVVTSISFYSANTGLTTGTHAWAALFDSSRNLLRQSTDDTAPVWTSLALKTFTLSSTFTTTYAGLHYLGLMIAATTPPTLFGITSDSHILGMAPALVGNSTTALTGTAPNPAAAPGAAGAMFYAYVS